MGKTKKQHYVPQEYLRRFCLPDEGLWILDKLDRSTFCTGPRAVGFEKFFYDLSEEAIRQLEDRAFNDEQYPERALKAFEDDFQGAVDLLLSEGPYVGISGDVRERLALYISVQYLRTPAAKARIVAAHESNLNLIHEDALKEQFGTEADLYRVGIPESHHSLVHLAALFQPEMWEGLARAILPHIWQLVQAPEGSHFITSDHPVARRAHIVGRPESFGGFGSKGVEISFPLSSRFALRIRESSFHDALRTADGSFAVSTAREVRLLNRMQVACSNRWLYGEDGDFSDELAFCVRHPFMGDMNRQEIETHEHVPLKHKNGSTQLIHMRSPERDIDWEAET